MKQWNLFEHSELKAITQTMVLVGSLYWELVDPVVADPVAQDNDKRNNIQMYTEIMPYKAPHRGRGQNFPMFISCRYLVELGSRQLGLPIADDRVTRVPTTTAARVNIASSVDEMPLGQMSQIKFLVMCL